MYFQCQDCQFLRGGGMKGFGNHPKDNGEMRKYTIKVRGIH